MSTDWMQTVNREMNLSEMALLARPNKSQADYSFRFFKPRRDLPFTDQIACAHALGERYCGGIGAELTVTRQECKAPVIPIGGSATQLLGGRILA